jgi:2-keto-4-pentenoate hydratase/2-oxohepta-3-ene-1,7-dioic acid hydratase in catechol pathway
MHLIRHLSSSGPAYAALQADGSVREISGDIFGDFRMTDRVIKPGKRLAPIVPTNILCIGLNYRKHAAESKQEPPARPVLFVKNTAAVQNPGDPIEIPVKLASTKVDYECELAVVIGKRCKNATRATALDYVLGYTCGNDVSARDWQRDFGGGQWCQAKSFDTFCPLGPVLVTRDEIPNPNALRIRTILNGETMQDWNTNDMVFDVPALIEFLSGSKTLLPGTVIMTGTPHGVGFARNPPVWLKAGDTVTIDIEKIGALTNPVVNEPTAEEQMERFAAELKEKDWGHQPC